MTKSNLIVGTIGFSSSVVLSPNEQRLGEAVTKRTEYFPLGKCDYVKTKFNY